MQNLKSYSFLTDHDIVVFSHLRWNFVYQRPQHLLSRFANYTRIFFIEEPIFKPEQNHVSINEVTDNVFVVTPYLKQNLSEQEVLLYQQTMIDALIQQKNITQYYSWYYTPMALLFSDHLTPDLIIYDCMDELAAFKNAPQKLKELERELMRKADIVFTGGNSIYEAKKHQHQNIYSFPSSIDKEHFAKARTIGDVMEDQKDIPHPRFGFFGVLDERFDINLIAQVAEQKPDWHFILIGPVAKISRSSLPNFNNIHYLGTKTYEELPGYLAGWDVAVIPFAINDSTKYISPTKTPEYLAGGKPVISTPIRDVVKPYGQENLVHIVANAEEFIEAANIELSATNRQEWLNKTDTFLADNSWNNTWNKMAALIEETAKQSSLIKL